MDCQFFSTFLLVAFAGAVGAFAVLFVFWVFVWMTRGFGLNNHES
jgi:hypothetical protein